MKTWLSSTFTNQDTCIEGFSGTGTNGIVKTIVSESITEMASLVHNLLKMVHDPSPKGGSGGGGGGGGGGFPAWVSKHSRKLLQASPAAADVTVAADGTGDYTTVMEAVQAAPNYSPNHYIIYIKRGIYRENVEITKKKWNMMMIGDGMGATVITGNRSYIDGWTTYASATFGMIFNNTN